MLTESKIDNFLEEELDDSDYDFMEDADLMEKMFDLISNLDTEKLTDDQIEQATEIIDLVAGETTPEGSEKEDEDEVSEIAVKKVRINRRVKRKRKIAYRKKRAKLKNKAKKFRKSAKFKRWKRMSKLKKRSGKTASGKRIRKFI
jgi:hypothetical protein